MGDGYGYDLAINPARNAILTSSFTGWNNYMRDLGEVVGDVRASSAIEWDPMGYHFGGTNG